MTFEAVPGPGAVTYGQNIAYSSTFTTHGNPTQRVGLHAEPKSACDPHGGPVDRGHGSVIDQKSDTDPDERRVRLQRPAQLRPEDPPMVVTVWSISGVSSPSRDALLSLTLADGMAHQGGEGDQRERRSRAKRLPRFRRNAEPHGIASAPAASSPPVSSGARCEPGAPNLSDRHQDVNKDNPVADVVLSAAVRHEWRDCWDRDDDHGADERPDPLRGLHRRARRELRPPDVQDQDFGPTTS